MTSSITKSPQNQVRVEKVNIESNLLSTFEVADFVAFSADLIRKSQEDQVISKVIHQPNHTTDFALPTLYLTQQW